MKRRKRGSLPIISERFLRITGTSAAKWAKRYGIKAFTYPCIVCGRPCTTSIPFAVSPSYRGLIAPVCECGHPTPPYSIVCITGTFFKG